MLSLTLYALLALRLISLPEMRLPEQENPGKDYVIVNVGRLPSGNSPNVLAINNSGQIIGNMEYWGVDSSFLRDGFLWEAGALAPLPARGGRDTYASAINDRGDIVGQAHWEERIGLDVLDTREEFQPVIWGEVRYHPFLLPRDMLYYTPMALSQKRGMALAINNKREIIGEENPETKNKRYILWSFLDTKGRKRKKTLLPANWWKPLGITDAGEMIAREYGRENYRLGRWIRWKNGKQEPLTLPTDKTFQFNGMNAAGWLAGSWSNEKTKQRGPCLWKEGAIQELELINAQSGTAMGVNGAGDVVGFFIPAQGKSWEWRACLWLKGKPIDLNTWLPPNSGWMLKEARAINDRGQIVGQGEVKGKPAAFLLTPRILAPVSTFTPEEETPEKKSLR